MLHGSTLASRTYSIARCLCLLSFALTPDPLTL